MTSKRALLLGGSFSALPFFQILKSEGYEITVAGRDPNEPCHALADESIAIDYSDKHALLAAFDQQRFDCIVPSCNDYAYLSAAHVAAQRSLPGFDPEGVALTIHTKEAFKQFAAAFGLGSPQRLDWENLTEDQRNAQTVRRLIVKPDDAFSGIGISVASTPEEIVTSIGQARAASRSGRFVVEEFFDGSLHSHSCFLQNGRIIDEFFVDEFCTLNQFQVNCSNYPSRLPTHAHEGLRNEIGRIAEGLALTDGLLHTQFLWNGTEFMIVECMRRCPGDLFGRQIELSTGYPYHFNVIAPFLGLPFRRNFASLPHPPVARHTISSTSPSLISSISLRTPTQRMEFIPLRRSGETLSGARTDKAGILFFIYEPDVRPADIPTDFRDQVKIGSEAAAIPAPNGGMHEPFPD